MSKVGAIRPCPFCGSANVNVETDPLIAGRTAVFCKSCKAHGPIVRSERYAVASWNDGVRRVVMDGGERLATADATCVALEAYESTREDGATMAHVRLAGDGSSVDVRLTVEQGRAFKLGEDYEVAILHKGHADE